MLWYAALTGYLAVLLCFAVGTPCSGQTADPPEEASAVGGNEPGYDVELGARDPFLPAEVGAGGEGAAGGSVSAAVKLLRDAVNVSIVMFSADEKNAFAVINNQRVAIGENVEAVVTGRKVSLVLKALHRSPPGVTLDYNGQEFEVFTK